MRVSILQLTTGKMKGKYANTYQIGFNQLEFVLDFGQSYRGDEDEYFHTRIVSTPTHTKDLCTTLMLSIQKYEKQYGPIGKQ